MCMQILNRIRSRLSDEHAADDGCRTLPIYYYIRCACHHSSYIYILYTQRIGPIDIGVTYNRRIVFTCLSIKK